MNKLGMVLRKFRKDAGMSLKDVYNATGISDSKLSRIENGANSSGAEPSILKALAVLYNIDLIELYLTAGYLDDKALSSYERTFRGVELLTDDEKRNIQNQIDLFTKGRKRP